MKKIYAKKEEGVSPVIATILMVAITVVLAATVYIMVAGMGSGGTNKLIAGLNYNQQTSNPGSSTVSKGYVNFTVSMSNPSSAAYSKVTIIVLLSGTSYKITLGTDGSGTSTPSGISAKILDMNGDGKLSDQDGLYIYSTSMALTGAQVSLSISGYSGNAQATVPTA